MKPRKPRWRKWLIISVVSLAVVLGAGYIGLNMAVDYVLKSMLSGSDMDGVMERALDGDLDLDSLFAEDSPAISGASDSGTASTVPSGEGDGSANSDGQASGSTGAGNSPSNSARGESGNSNSGGGSVSGSNDAAGSSDSSESSSSSGSSTGNGSGNNTGSGSGNTPSNSNNIAEGSGNIEAGGENAGSGSSGSGANLSYTPEVTRDKVAAIQESVTLGEKMKLAGVLLKRLNSSDIDLFIQMLSGGMTVEEKREAKKIMLEKLTPEEYNELIQIAAKYGLSRGQTYEESLNDYE